MWNKKINIAHYGEEHPETGITLDNLGNAYGSLGDYEKKKEILEKALKITIKNYGKEHPSTGMTLANLGTAYRDLGDAEKALAYYKQAHGIFVKHFCPEPRISRQFWLARSACCKSQLLS